MALNRRRIERIMEVAEEAAAVTIALAKLRAGSDGAAVATVATVIERELRAAVAASLRRRRKQSRSATTMQRTAGGQFKSRR